MVWKGKPHWNGKTVDVNLDDFFMVFAYGVMPFILLLENCEDKFLPVFSTDDKLREFMEKNGKTVGVDTPSSRSQMPMNSVIRYGSRACVSCLIPDSLTNITPNGSRSSKTRTACGSILTRKGIN